MQFDYYYGEMAEQYSFVYIPKLLVTEKSFGNLSIPAKILYGFLLDRMGLAMKNEWLDEENRIYIIYPVEEIAKDMGISRKKVRECLIDLERMKLIERKHQGNGLPSLLYIKDFLIA